MSAEQKSVSCCRQAAWMTNLAPASMITRTKTPTTAGTGIAARCLRTSFGDVKVLVPRDRKGEFEPQLLKKNQTSISQDIEEKILSMYAKGMTTSDIESHIRDIYGIEVSDTTVSWVTDKILPIAKEWQQRPLKVTSLP